VHANTCALFRHPYVITLQQAAAIKKTVKKGTEKDLANGNGIPTYLHTRAWKCNASVSTLQDYSQLKQAYYYCMHVRIFNAEP